MEKIGICSNKGNVGRATFCFNFGGILAEMGMARWKYDELYRYIKQCYNLEDVRVQSYISIRNIVVLVLAVSYFASAYLGQTIKLQRLVERIFIVSKDSSGFQALLTLLLQMESSI
jgi:hypothetical protein